jgi:chorismate--pyruvate lyase
VRRGELEFARLRAGHPLVLRARAALGGSAPPDTVYHARRCVYRRHQGTLLVTEVFLPAVLDLIAASSITNQD